MHVDLLTAICDDLAEPVNGTISYSITPPLLEGTLATHSCINGYETSSGAMRTCQSDRMWSGVEITCQRELHWDLMGAWTVN